VYTGSIPVLASRLIINDSTLVLKCITNNEIKSEAQI